MTDLTTASNQLYEVATAVETAVAQATESIRNGTMAERAEVWALLRWIKETAEEIEKQANIAMPKIQSQLAEDMEAEGLDEVKLAGHTFKRDNAVYCNVNKERRYAVIEWLKAHPTGRELLREDYHPKSLEKFVKDEMAQGKLPPGDLIKISINPTVTARKLPQRG